MSKPKTVPTVDYIKKKIETKLAEKLRQRNATGKEGIQDQIFVLPGHNLVVNIPKPQPKKEPEESLVGDTNETSEEPKTPEAQKCDTTRQNATRPLPPKQVRALEALATGYTVSDAAKDAGVHRSTVHTWLKNNPEFVQQLALYEEEVMHEIRARSLDLVSLGLQTLEEILSSDCRTQTKIAALKTINIGALVKLSFGKTREIKPPSESSIPKSKSTVIPNVTEDAEDED